MAILDSQTETQALVRRKTMLIVDPEHEVDTVLERLSKKEGWNIERAPSNDAVLSLAETNCFDLIITGQNTSGSEDIDLLRKIRSIRPHVRVIILAGSSTPEDVIESLRENAFSYFRTPFDADLLGDIVSMAMTEPCWDDGIEVISATRRWIRLLARCTSDTANRLIQFLRQVDMPHNEKEELAVAAHEILLNAMEHGGHFDPSQYVEIGYLRTKRAVVCRVKDPGQGFALNEIPHSAINSAPGDLFSHLAVREKKGLRPGGFGLLLANKHVDEVIYGEHGNDVILVKYLEPHESIGTKLCPGADFSVPMAGNSGYGARGPN
jgi:anti-sigma regulatory factor (Ser/Thr protein kinase)/ActR/RegA family two-component response regulator